ncbi:MAG: alpha/beta fold hydrolase [Pseudomonadota bacterium]
MVDLLAITTRAPSDVAGQIYSGERSREVSSHLIQVSVPPNHELGRLEWPSGSQPDAENEFAALTLQPAVPEEAWSWFDARGNEGRLLIFVHGYNVSFPEAVYRLAQITADVTVDAAPVLFSWPSNGDLLGYYYDKESATAARDAFERVLTEAAARDGVTQITLLAHSMGSWITMETLRQMAIRRGDLPAKITDVILAAPDLDIHVFEHQFESLGEARPHFTFLVSSDDRALGLSKVLAGGVQRLGAMDPSQEPYRSRIEATPGVTVVDLSGIEADGTRHNKFAESEEMMTFARRAMGDQQNRATARGSIGAQAGAVIVALGLGVADLSE